MHSQAEVCWHDEFAEVLAAMPRDGGEDRAPGLRQAFAAGALDGGRRGA